MRLPLGAGQGMYQGYQDLQRQGQRGIENRQRDEMMAQREAQNAFENKLLQHQMDMRQQEMARKNRERQGANMLAANPQLMRQLTPENMMQPGFEGSNMMGPASPRNRQLAMASSAPAEAMIGARDYRSYEQQQKDALELLNAGDARAVRKQQSLQDIKDKSLVAKEDREQSKADLNAKAAAQALGITTPLPPGTTSKMLIDAQKVLKESNAGVDVKTVLSHYDSIVKKIASIESGQDMYLPNTNRDEALGKLNAQREAYADVMRTVGLGKFLPEAKVELPEGVTMEQVEATAKRKGISTEAVIKALNEKAK